MRVVETEIAESVMTITLNDEERRNALSRQLLSELIDAIDAGENDRRVRVIVVTNRGSTFCAGANLAERASPHPSGTGTRSIDFADLFERIRRSPKPFVGRIAGHCVAGGVGLAAVMDISVAIDSAKFGFTEVRVGVAPAIISVVCLPKMRLGDAQSAFLRGNRFSAEEAARIGLINRAVSPDGLDREVEAVVNDLLAGEPHALAAAKQLSFSVTAMSPEEAFAWTSRLSGELFQSDGAREGMAAFLEKRPASWVEKISRD
jgi:methylglutaconyl-CoA hydratase